ncbi:MAG: outer membrane protein OmpA [Pseudomonadota bacterium]
MSKKTWVPLLIAAGVALSAMPFTASAQSKQGYWTQGVEGPVWKSGFGLCWRAGYWTPAMAIPECDPDLMPRPVVTPPPPPPPPPPLVPEPVKPAPKPAPVAEKVTLAADVLFDFDKSVIKPEGKNKLDDLAAKVRAINLEVVIAIGHTDSIGSDAYNQKLSVRRAESVKAYLVSKGIEPNRIYTEGKGEKQPVASNKTKDGRQKNRRVEIEVIGTRK